MTPAYILPLADANASLEAAGGKGAALARLAAAGLPVPDGFHITTAAYQAFIAENQLAGTIQAALQGVDPARPSSLEAAAAAIQQAFQGAPLPGGLAGAIETAWTALGADAPLAVRSSATAEDLPELSFAGQQESFLNVCGLPALLDAVQCCWASLWSGRAIAYRLQHGVDQGAVRLAVVVQRLVPAEAAGVLFTANPLSGARQEAVLSAAWGLGEAIVGGLVTPDTLVMDKASGRVLSRQTADKQVMTVRQAAGTAEQAVPAQVRTADVLSDAQAAELVCLGVQIEALFGLPVDIEWALAGGQAAILQARPITALPEPPLALPEGWPLPDPKKRYGRGSIFEFLPDPLTPLFHTLGLPVIDDATRRLFAGLTQDTRIWQRPMLYTIHDYGYQELPSGAQLLSYLHLFGRVGPLLRSIEQRWRQGSRPPYLAAVSAWQAHPLEQLAAVELLSGTRALLEAAADLYTSLQSGVVAAAMGAEAIFTWAYPRLFQPQGGPPALTFLLGFENTPLQSEKSLFDLAAWCRQQAGLAEGLARTATSALAEGLAGRLPPPGLEAQEWESFRARFNEHLAQFGHLLYNLDFSNPLPAEQPAPLLEMLKLFLAGQGRDPYQRQQGAAAARQQAVQAVLERLKGWRLRLFRKLYGWVEHYVPLREDGIADLGLGYPLLRRLLGELGHRLVQAGALAQPAQVYWLLASEAQQAAAALDEGLALAPLGDDIPQRMALWQAEKRLIPPSLLPVGKKLYGVNMDQLMPARRNDPAQRILHGASACPGRVTAPARVLSGPQDFDQMRSGEVLVAAITTPAWTPLFALACGVVTDIGGPLSHSSIVAREYGIPAVLGTGVATHRIHSGQIITVDGSAGTVELED